MEVEHYSARQLNLDWTVELWTADTFSSAISKKLKIKMNNLVFRRIVFYAELKRALNKNDIVIMRHMPLDFLGLLLTKSEKQKLIVYFHAKEDSILKKRGLRGRLFHLINSSLNKLILRNLFGIAAVTKDLLKHYSALAKKCNNFYLYPNGTLIDTNELDTLPDPIRCDSTIKIAFVASQFYEWNGLEALLINISKTPVETSFQLILIGVINDIQRDMIENSKADIVQYDLLDDEGLNRVLRDVDITLGAFNLQSVGLYEGCTLKVRQSLGAGIPVFSGHIDSIFDESFPYYRVGEPSIEKILEFAEEMRNISRKEVALSSIPLIAKKNILESFYMKIKSDVDINDIALEK